MQDFSQLLICLHDCETQVSQGMKRYTKISALLNLLDHRNYFFSGAFINISEPCEGNVSST